MAGSQGGGVVGSQESGGRLRGLTLFHGCSGGDPLASSKVRAEPIEPIDAITIDARKRVRHGVVLSHFAVSQRSIICDKKTIKTGTPHLPVL